MSHWLTTRRKFAEKAVRAAACAVVAAACMAAAVGHGQQAKPVVLDRVVAVVNRQVILASDVDDDIQLSVLDPVRGAEGVLTPQHALEELISRTLIQQQIRQEDLETIRPSAAEVKARIDAIRKELPACVRAHCSTEAGWKAFLAAHDLNQQRVEAYLRNRIEILGFIEERFRQGIQITQQQIAKYYRDTLLPQYPPGETAPTLDQVSSRIREILLEQQVNVLFGNWLDNLRKQGNVEIVDPAYELTQAQTVQGGGGK